MLFLLSMVEDEKSCSKVELLYNNYKHAMLYVANKILKDQHLAEDAVHKAFIKTIINVNIIMNYNRFRWKD